MRMRVGVLALQGDFREHLQVLERLGVEGVKVRRPRDLEGVQGLILPGGESTTIASLLEQSGLLEVLRVRGREGFPLYGTCAGLILLAREIVDGRPKQHLGLIDLAVRRNAYGRQRDSFEADLEVQGLGALRTLRAIFIRAPQVERVGPGVEVLAELEGRPVLARQARVLVSAFHPELTDDTRVHEHFLSLIESRS